MSYDLFHRLSPGRFYRGNLHTHSTRSDGGMTPEAVCAAYRQQGYDFLAITDHYVGALNYAITDTTAFRTDRFTTLIGSELHAPTLANGTAWHIVAVGLPADFGPLRAGETGAELAERAALAGAFVTLAHPRSSGASVADLMSIPAAHAIEAYNEISAALSDRADSWYHVDALLSSGRRVTAIGADDAHFRTTMPPFPDSKAEMSLSDPNGFIREIQSTAVDPLATESGEEAPAGFRAWVMVRAERLEPDLLLEALKVGDFYSSQGPVIHDLVVDEGQSTLHVVSSPARSVFATGRPDYFSQSRNGSQLTHTTFSIRAYRGSYVRVTIVDHAGLRAWSNPIWLD